MAHSKRGTILITVLWVVTILVVIVLGMVYEARKDVDRTILMRDRSKAYWLARAGVERAKYDVAVSKLSANEEDQSKSFYRYEMTEGFVECSIESDSAKMPLNTGNRDLWKQAFKVFQLEESAIDELCDAIIDWRDPDDETQLNGAERDYYQSLNPPYEPRNGPFMSVEELLLVRGITEEMFYGNPTKGTPGLKDIVGLSNANQPRLDINSANEAVLMAFLEITKEEAQAIIQARQEHLFQNVQEAGSLVSIEAADKLNQFFMAYQGNQISIRSTGYVYNSPARYTVEDVVRYVGGGQLFVTVSHKDFSLDHAAPLETEEDE
ncbi:MAG: general secretion pathway protein GspK [Acidobacteria bacterium]|nr:general secretion pathway protein GspK [Acidobacteriota bacterium]MCB9398920.1 general secretion pathway protein GspK [Acidobacteriota bacterium]